MIGVRDSPARDILSLGALGPGGEQNRALSAFRRVFRRQRRGENVDLLRFCEVFAGEGFGGSGTELYGTVWECTGVRGETHYNRMVQVATA